MKIKLAYGREGLDIGLPDDLNLRVIEPVYVEGLADQAQAVRNPPRAAFRDRPRRTLRPCTLHAMV